MIERSDESVYRESRKCLRQIRLRILALGKLSQTGLYRRSNKELAENVYLPLQLFIRNRLNKLLRRDGSLPIKLSELCRSCPRHSQRLALCNDLTHQSNLLKLGRIKTASCKQQIANHRIPQITLQTRDSTESGNQSQPQLRKTKSRHLIGDDQIAHQRQLKAAAESHSMHRRDCGQGRSIDRVQHPVNTLQIIANTLSGVLPIHLLRTAIQLSQVGPSTKPSLELTINNECVSFILETL